MYEIACLLFSLPCIAFARATTETAKVEFFCGFDAIRA